MIRCHMIYLLHAKFFFFGSNFMVSLRQEHKHTEITSNQEIIRDFLISWFNYITILCITRNKSKDMRFKIYLCLKRKEKEKAKGGMVLKWSMKKCGWASSNNKNRKHYLHALTKSKNNTTAHIYIHIYLYISAWTKKKKVSALMAGSGVFAEIIEGEVFKYYADGEWKKSSSGKSVAIVNPTTRNTQYKVQGIVYLHTHKQLLNTICLQQQLLLFKWISFLSLFSDFWQKCPLTS